MKKRIIVLGLCILCSCGSESSSGPDKKESSGTEIPCNAENEGMIIKPADSDKEHICKDGSWNVVDSSRHCEDCKDEAISISSSSTLNNNVILSASDESSSSIVNSSSSSEKIGESSSSEQPTESSNNKVGESSSSVETAEESSSSEKIEESSSSEEITMFLCDDGVTYVLDLTNCETESSSSNEIEESSSSEKIEESSSSEATTQSSSGNVEESSSSEESEKSSNSETSSSSSEKSSSSGVNIPSKEYDCSIYNCVTTEFLNPEVDYGELLDIRDNHVYRTVKIGNQTWMAQNLNYEIEPSYCMNNRTDSCFVYGRYYPYSVAMDSINQGGCGYGDGCKNNKIHQGICPDGWHLPDSTEIAELITYLKETYSADSIKAIRSTKTWAYDCPGTNESGLSMLGTGRVIFNDYGYYDTYSKKESNYNWGNGWRRWREWETPDKITYLGGRYGLQKKVYLFTYGPINNEIIWGEENMTKKAAFPVRCLKN